MTKCSLCHCSAAELIFQTSRRSFFACSACQLIFVPRAEHLSQSEEKLAYSHHRNDPDDRGYQNFLSQLVKPLSSYLSPGLRGLDYGSGPGPALSQMLNDYGVFTENYDPYFSPAEALLSDRYDFVTCTEVVEHFRNPLEEWRKLTNLVKPGGLLAIMTSFAPSNEKLAQWSYKEDLTHVAFYREETFRWIANDQGLREVFRSNPVIIFQKN
jgi:SAM-dependent methyltransferase